jgi:hypothetical protein
MAVVVVVVVLKVIFLLTKIKPSQHVDMRTLTSLFTFLYF